ncbi:MAG: cytochrome c-type biogenesis protein CcmH [Proteobacteria bacterium]|nr:cytochrome c-type biogenesis protein CcmH [Pseudomonadota bacterium]
MKLLLIATAALTFATPLHAADLRFDDPRKQERYETLINELRCLVCQNQTIADSNAELALDLREKVAELIADGKSDAEVIEFVTARYGDFVLYRPPVQSNTLLLWLGPLLLLVIAGTALILTVRHRAKFADSDEECTP